ncbi:MAG TPA: GDP-mannose 4,6-dehydratase [Polyangiaceae bacterium]|jgi:GDPmannose 4,6-dehydratase
MKRAAVIGCAGQDGRLLVERLSRDADVVGVDAGDVDLADPDAARAWVERVEPSELYFLAAHHHSSEAAPDEAAELRACTEVHVTSWVNVLDALRRHAPACRAFYAGSSHMFGRPTETPQSEKTPFAPRSPYAITKVAGAHVAALFRERGMHVSVGILYNHESPLRGPQFVSQRIVRGARSAARDRSFKLVLADLSAVVDWGWAPDYVDAMIRMVRESVPDDYVVATGKAHTVRDFVANAFAAVGLDWRDHVVEDPSLPKSKTSALVGDATKLRTRTGWSPTSTFEEMIKALLFGDVK